jgi:hypothetical protein
MTNGKRHGTASCPRAFKQRRERETMMLFPKEFDDQGARAHGIQRGWWAVSSDDTPISGPYPSREAALVGIAKRGEDQPSGRPGEDPVPPPE